jgi:hypothetical protein
MPGSRYGFLAGALSCFVCSSCLVFRHLLLLVLFLVFLAAFVPDACCSFSAIVT